VVRRAVHRREDSRGNPFGDVEDCAIGAGGVSGNGDADNDRADRPER
jgi:hypothetical protein